jgi:hypothetical protein
VLSQIQWDWTARAADLAEIAAFVVLLIGIVASLRKGPEWLAAIGRAAGGETVAPARTPQARRRTVPIGRVQNSLVSTPYLHSDVRQEMVKATTDAGLFVEGLPWEREGLRFESGAFFAKAAKRRSKLAGEIARSIIRTWEDTLPANGQVDFVWVLPPRPSRDETADYAPLLRALQEFQTGIQVDLFARGMLQGDLAPSARDAAGKNCIVLEYCSNGDDADRYLTRAVSILRNDVGATVLGTVVLVGTQDVPPELSVPYRVLFALTEVEPV